MTSPAPNSSILEVVAPDRRRHRQQMFDLISKVFSHLGYYTLRDRCANGGIDKSHYDWETSRIGLMDSRVVTHFGVWKYQMRIGSAQVQVAGVGMVATDADYRKRGLLTQTAAASISALQSLGYDLSILFGIPGFYDRFGYVPAWSNQTWIMNAKHLPTSRPQMAIRRFAPRPRADLAALFNRQNAGLTGTAIRPTYPHAFLGGESRQGFLWRDRHSRIAGYVVLSRSGSRINCCEAIGDVNQVLRTLGMLARKWGALEVAFETLPYHSALCRQLRRMDCRCETQYHCSSGPMIRTIRLASVLTKMAGELSHRLRRSELANWRGRLRISNAHESVILDIRRSQVAIRDDGSTPHAIQGTDHVAQLLIGSADPWEIVEAAGIKLRGNARRLIPVLFPPQHPQLHAMDRY